MAPTPLNSAEMNCATIARDEESSFRFMTGFEIGQTIASGVTALFTICTFGALVWYTIETKKLRISAQKQVTASEKQNEHLLLPILFFVQSKYNANTPETIMIRNIGSGPAFNASTQPMPFGSLKMHFQHPGTIAAGEEHDVRVLIMNGDKIVDDSSTVLLFWNRLGSSFTGGTNVTYKAANNLSHIVTVTFKAEGHQILFEKREQVGIY